MSYYFQMACFIVFYHFICSGANKTFFTNFTNNFLDPLQNKPNDVESSLASHSVDMNHIWLNHHTSQNQLYELCLPRIPNFFARLVGRDSLVPQNLPPKT
jgi:hypothetical protein